MKNRLLIPVIIAAIASYGGFWLFYANRAKTFVSHELQKLEQPDAKGNRLQYDALHMGGYPFSYEVAIKNPRYGNGEQQEAFLDGVLKIGTNLLGTTYWLEKEGEVHVLDNADPKRLHHVVISGESTLTADMHKPYSLDAMINPFEEIVEHPVNLHKKHLFEEVKKLRFDGKNIVLKEGSGDGHVLGEFGRLSAAVSMEKAPENLDQYFLSLIVEGMLMQDKFPRYLSHFTANPQPVENAPLVQPELMFWPKNLNFEFDGSAALPHDHQEGFPTHLLIHVDRFNMTGDFGEKWIEGHFAYKDQNHLLTMQIGVNGTVKVTEENDRKIIETFLQALKSAASDPENKDDVQREKLQKLLHCCQADLEKVPPRYHEFGTIKTALNGNLSYHQENVSGEIKINRFDVTSDLYGMESHGFAKGHQVNINGQYAIELIDYKSMIEDLIAYYNRIHFLFPIFAESPENAPPLIPQISVPKIIKFLRTVSDNPEKDANDITITIDFLEPQSVKIGTLTLPQAMIEWGKLARDLDRDLGP